MDNCSTLLKVMAEMSKVSADLIGHVNAAPKVDDAEKFEYPGPGDILKELIVLQEKQEKEDQKNREVSDNFFE